MKKHSLRFLFILAVVAVMMAATFIASNAAASYERVRNIYFISDYAFPSDYANSSHIRHKAKGDSGNYPAESASLSNSNKTLMIRAQLSYRWYRFLDEIPQPTRTGYSVARWECTGFGNTGGSDTGHTNWTYKSGKSGPLVLDSTKVSSNGKFTACTGIDDNAEIISTWVASNVSNKLLDTDGNGGNNYAMYFYPVWQVNSYQLDVNYICDGNYNSPSGIITFDVYLNGSLVSSNTTDYYRMEPYGTVCRVVGKSLNSNYHYVNGNEVTGTVGASYTMVDLRVESHNSSGVYYTLTNSSTATKVSQSSYCTSRTLYKWTYCSKCGNTTNVKSAGTVNGTITSHNYTYSPATSSYCTGKSFTQTGTCSYGCGTTTTRSATGTRAHSYSAWSPATSGYCPGQSVAQTRSCSYNCGATESQTVYGTGSHNSSGTKYVATNSFSGTGVSQSSYCVGQTVYKFTYCSKCSGNASSGTPVAGTGTHGTMTPHAAVAATCTQTGNNLYYTCSKCNKAYQSNSTANTNSTVYNYTIPVDSNNHSWNGGSVTTAATCTAAGVRTYTCTRNSSHTKTESIPIDQNAHNWNSGSVTTAATCTSAGVRTYTCTRSSSHTRTESIAAAGHGTMSRTAAVASTCNSTGNVEYWTCSVCKNKYNSSSTASTNNSPLASVTTAVDPNNHSSKQTVAAEAATCTGTGHNTYYKCNGCSKVYSDSGYTVETTVAAQTTAIDPSNHNGHLAANTSAVPATCTESGTIASWKCSACNNYYSNNAGTAKISASDVTLPALGHDYAVTVTAPTCTAAGYTTHTCSRGDSTYTDTPVAALGHDYSSEVTTLPTCTSDGERTYTCSRGDSSYTEVESATGHQPMTFHPATVSNCTTHGNTAYYSCPQCNLNYSTNDTSPSNISTVTAAEIELPLDPDAHSWGEWVITPGVAGQSGTKSRTCLHNAEHVESLPYDYMGDLKIKGAKILLESDITLRFIAKPDAIADKTYTDPYMVLSVDGGSSVTTRDFTVSADGYVFDLKCLAPDFMANEVTATLYGTHDGKLCHTESMTYSIEKYCYNLLNNPAYASNTKLRTLLVDLLNYGTAAQRYMRTYSPGHNPADVPYANYRIDGFQSYATASAPTKTILSATDPLDGAIATKIGMQVLLGDNVSMRYYFRLPTGVDASGYRVRFYLPGLGKTFDKSVESNSIGYFGLIDDLNAAQLDEEMMITVIDGGGNAVSATSHYSISTYYEKNKNNADTYLAALVTAMMKYGDAAKAYIS